VILPLLSRTTQFEVFVKGNPNGSPYFSTIPALLPAPHHNIPRYSSRVNGSRIRTIFRGIQTVFHSCYTGAASHFTHHNTRAGRIDQFSGEPKREPNLTTYTRATTHTTLENHQQNCVRTQNNSI